MTRRAFAHTALAATAAQTALAQSVAPLTADQVLDRIRKNVGVPWREHVVFGSGSSGVKGIATTMMATFTSSNAPSPPA